MRVAKGSHSFIAWLEAHQRALRGAAYRRVVSPVQSLLLILGLGILLAIPGYLWILLESGRVLSVTFDFQPRVSLYFDDVSENELAGIADSLRTDPEIASLNVRYADAILEAYRRSLPEPELLDWLDGNPMPSLIEVLPRAMDVDSVKALESALRLRYPEAMLIGDIEWLLQMNALYRTIMVIFISLTTLLAGALTTMLAMAVMTDLVARRDEIAVSRIMGATDRFLRRSSLYDGAIAGMLGGGMGFLFLQVGVSIIREPMDRLAEAFVRTLTIPTPGMDILLVILLAGGMLGWIGARIGSELILRSERA